MKTMHRAGVFAAWACAGALFAAVGGEAQKTCPVTGKALDPAAVRQTWVEFNGFALRVADEAAAAEARRLPAFPPAAWKEERHPYEAALAALATRGKDDPMPAEPADPAWRHHDMAIALSRTCPVTGRGTTGKITLNHGRFLIFVCDAGCSAKAFKDWPGTLAKVKAARPAQAFCPFTGRPLSLATAPVDLAVEGFTFQAFDKASVPEKVDAAVFAALAKHGDAAVPVSQACPVMGNRVNKAVFLQKDGRRIHLCCKGCEKRVERRWDEMAKKLHRQAVDGDPDPLPEM